MRFQGIPAQQLTGDKLSTVRHHLFPGGIGQITAFKAGISAAHALQPAVAPSSLFAVYCGETEMGGLLPTKVRAIQQERRKFRIILDRRLVTGT